MAIDENGGANVRRRRRRIATVGGIRRRTAPWSDARAHADDLLYRAELEAL